MKFLLLFILVTSQAAFAQGLTDILFQRNSSFEDRQKVSEDLKSQGLKQPLEVDDAIAELCYEIDLCAQETTAFPQCEDIDPNDEEAVQNQPEECGPKYFRQKYSCSETVEKQTVKQLFRAKAMLSDISKLYSSLIQDHMMDALSRQYGVNFRELSRNRRAMEEYERQNPRAMEHIKILFKESLGMGAYTMDCYSNLNPILYTGNKASQLRYYNFFKSVINTMGMYPEFKKMVNRGAYLPKNILQEHHKIGNVICYQGFTSTAVHNPETDFGSKPSNSFLSGKCTQRLYISFSDGAEGGKLISSASAFKSEDEVLFEPGSCFRIDKVYPRTDEIPEDEQGDYECGEGERYNFEMTLIR